MVPPLFCQVLRFIHCAVFRGGGQYGREGNHSIPSHLKQPENPTNSFISVVWEFRSTAR